ncbi:MAG: hypothetical protein MUO68_23430 [Desulfobacteraceae bacterium]|nr:hypothetical protein [Desulfobacteraceae bacterium]
MGSLLGLKEYLAESYNTSVFDQAIESQEPWEFHLHNHRIIKSKVQENSRYDLRLSTEETGEELLPKTDVKLLYPADLSDSVRPFLKTDNKIRDLGLEPIISPRIRHHIKNKSLFPLIKERRVLFFTLMEGEIVKGLVTGFTRYEITVSLKGGIPVYILRHSVYDLRDKKGLCFLKSFQETRRDWEKSDLFVSPISEA